MFDLTDPADYDVAARRLIAQSDLQGGASLAALWQDFPERKQAQDLAAMILGSPQTGATGERAFQLAAMDETERKRLFGQRPDTGGGGGGISIFERAKQVKKT